MKKLKVILFLTLTVALLQSSISPVRAQVKFLNSAVVPAAGGSVSVKKDKFNNYVLKIQMENLAEAAKLTPPKSTYVVWMENDQNITKNIGQIKTSSRLFSKKLDATLETKSSSKPIKIFITAEYDGNIQTTESEIVITTDYFDLPKD